MVKSSRFNSAKYGAQIVITSITNDGCTMFRFQCVIINNENKKALPAKLTVVSLQGGHTPLTPQQRVKQKNCLRNSWE